MTTLTINEGETKSYSVRLTKQPHVNADDDWWVMIVVDGIGARGITIPMRTVSKGVSWVPSIGRTFDQDDWSQWKDIRITAHEDDDDEDHTIVFSSELWDHDAYCPPDLHGGGTPLAMVIVLHHRRRRRPTEPVHRRREVDEGGQAEFVVRLSKASDGQVKWITRQRTERRLRARTTPGQTAPLSSSRPAKHSHHRGADNPWWMSSTKRPKSSP